MTNERESEPISPGNPPTRGDDAWIMTSLNNLHGKVGQVENAVDAIKSSLKEIKDDAKEHRTSIDNLKKTIWFASGSLAIAIILGGWFFKGGLESFAESLGQSFANSVIEKVDQDNTKQN